MVTFTPELAFALGMRDRLMGVDADARRDTIARFDGCTYLERSYWDGYCEASIYCDNVARWAQGDREGANSRLRLAA